MYLTWVDCREPEYLFHATLRAAQAVVGSRVDALGRYTASMDVLRVCPSGSTELVERVFYGDIQPL